MNRPRRADDFHSGKSNSNPANRCTRSFRGEVFRLVHLMGPALFTLMLFGVTSGVASAQGTMDFSGATTLMTTFRTFAIYAGAVICFGGLIFAGIRMISGRFQIAAKFGNQADNVVANARSRRLYQARDWTVEERQKQAHFALTYVRDRSFERQDLIDERTLFVNAMRRGMGETTYQELRPNFEARVASGEFRLVRSGEHDSVRLFTTAQTIEAEREIIQRVLDGRSRALQLLSIERAIPLTESQRYLNRAERGVVEQILTSRDQVQGFQRGRGFEKTGLLRVIGEGAEQNGYRVEGFAETPRAARMHRDTEIPFDTLRGFLMRDLRPADALRQKHLYIVDESSLASTFEVREFLNRISRQDKVLFIGDIRHYQGVGAEHFEQLQRAGLQTAKLDQIASRQNVQHSKSSIERSSEALQPIIVPNRTETSGLGLAT